MSRVIPDGWEALPPNGPQRRELQTLAVLAAGLPEDYMVYHAVHWTNVEHAHAIYGEIDFVVVNQSGDLLIIEQKSGLLAETPDGLANMGSAPTRRLVQAQMARTVDGLRAKLAHRLGGQSVDIEYLLFCPDHAVRHRATAGISPERIVDSTDKQRLVSMIQALLGPGQAAPIAVRVHRFLRDIIQLETDVVALQGEARMLTTRLAGGLAHWARQLEMSPFRLRVTGTAGSGKTQLALAEYRAAIEAGKRPLYVCYNRPLADHFAAISPEGGLVATFHMLCDRVVQMSGKITRFSQPGAFDQLVLDAAAAPVPPSYFFDTVIVDEGQDFKPEWRDIVLRHGHPDARLIWLEDPLQNLYQHPQTELPGWVRLRAQSNYRSPRSVVHWLSPLLLGHSAIEAAAPIASSDVDMIVYDDTAALHLGVKEAIKRCYAEGFRERDVAVLSYHGRGQSQLLNQSRLGAHRLRSFSGQYDENGQPVFSAGDVLMESVYRFKGQSAPAVVFAEIDFETLDERAVRKLFVGATRATMKLILVVSAKSAALLKGQMNEANVITPEP